MKKSWGVSRKGADDEKNVLWGAGNHAREVIWLLNSINENCRPTERWEIVGLIDDVTEDVDGQKVDGIPVFGSFDYFEQVDCDEIHVLAAVGEPEAKRIMVEKAKQFPLAYATLIHPSAML